MHTYTLLIVNVARSCHVFGVAECDVLPEIAKWQFRQIWNTEITCKVKNSIQLYMYDKLTYFIHKH